MLEHRCVVGDPVLVEYKYVLRAIMMPTTRFVSHDTVVFPTPSRALLHLLHQTDVRTELVWLAVARDLLLSVAVRVQIKANLAVLLKRPPPLLLPHPHHPNQQKDWSNVEKALTLWNVISKPSWLLSNAS